MDEMTTACEGCPDARGKLYTATPADGSAPHTVRYCDDCAAAYEGADMGAGGCEAMGTLTPVEPDPAAVVVAALARKRADREHERRLDEQSRAARGEDYGISRLRTP